MKTLRKKIIEVVFCEDKLPNVFSTLKDNTVYVSGNKLNICMKCLCGCGSPVALPVNVNPEGWQLEIDDKNRITVLGSFLVDKCKAHYVIQKNKVIFLP